MDMKTPTQNEMKKRHLYLSDRLIERLDTFRFKNKFASRSQAVVFLLEAALAAKVAPEKSGAK